MIFFFSELGKSENLYFSSGPNPLQLITYRAQQYWESIHNKESIS